MATPLPSRIRAIREKTNTRSCPAHRAWVRRHHCVVPDCTQLPVECAHVRMGTDGGVGLKPSDRFTISLCQTHHAEQHKIGEPAFERKYSLDLLTLANAFFLRSPHRDKLIAQGERRQP